MVRKIVLDGNAGMGKSTYVHNMALEWAKGDTWLNKKFSLVILVRLGELKSSHTFLDWLKKLIPGRSAGILSNYFKNSNNHGKILVILDAFDEFRQRNECVEINNLLQHKWLGEEAAPALTVIITSRIPQSEDIEENEWLLRSQGLNVDLVVSTFGSRITNLTELSLERKDFYRNPLFLGMTASVGHVVEELFDLTSEFCKLVVRRFIQFRSNDDSHDFDSVWSEVSEFLSYYAVNQVEADFLCDIPLSKTVYNVTSGITGSSEDGDSGSLGDESSQAAEHIPAYATERSHRNLFNRLCGKWCCCHSQDRQNDGQVGEQDQENIPLKNFNGKENDGSSEWASQATMNLESALKELQGEAVYFMLMNAETFVLCCEVGLLWCKPRANRDEMFKDFHAGDLEAFFPHQLFIEYFAAMNMARNPRIIRAMQNLPSEKLQDFFETPMSYFMTAYSSAYRRCLVRAHRKEYELAANHFYCPWLYQAQKIMGFDENLVAKFVELHGNHQHENGLLLKGLSEGMLKKARFNQNPVIELHDLLLDSNSMDILRIFSNVTSFAMTNCKLFPGGWSKMETWLEQKADDLLSLELWGGNEMLLSSILILAPKISGLKKFVLTFFLEDLDDCHYLNMVTCFRSISSSPGMKLKTINLHGSTLVKNGISLIQALPTTLQKLCMDSCELSIEALKALSMYIKEKNKGLKKLHLDDNEAISGASDKLFSAICCSNIEDLVLRYCKLSNLAAKHLADGISTSTNLKNLHLQGNEEVGSSLELARSFPFGILVTLDLQSCDPSQEFVVSLLRNFKGMELPSIKEILIGGIPLSMQGSPPIKVLQDIDAFQVSLAL